MKSTQGGDNRQERNKNPYRVHAGPPAHTEKQAAFVLRVLREAGNLGVNRNCFLIGDGPCNGRQVTQVGARLDELTKQGYIFESKMLPGDKFVTYYLRREPIAPLPAPKTGWRAQNFSFGKRPAESAPDQRPLFEQASGDNRQFLALESGVDW